MDICLIPARSGSKRIKNKNLLSFFGNPMISYSIKTAIKSKLFDKVLVTTDSKKIAKISKNFGAEIPFLRPKKLANDHATDNNVIEHFLSFSKKLFILSFKFAIYLPHDLPTTLATHPFQNIFFWNFDLQLPVYPFMFL